MQRSATGDVLDDLRALPFLSSSSSFSSVREFRTPSICSSSSSSSSSSNSTNSSVVTVRELFAGSSPIRNVENGSSTSTDEVLQPNAQWSRTVKNRDVSAEPLASSVRLHRSHICWLRTARCARALCSAHLFAGTAPKLVGK